MIRAGRGYLSTGEVAKLHKVTGRTAGRWAAAGKIDSETTRGGHRRYPAGQFADVLDSSGEQ
jgi:excisionase family DNA binding protein